MKLGIRLLVVQRLVLAADIAGANQCQSGFGAIENSVMFAAIQNALNSRYIGGNQEELQLV